MNAKFYKGKWDSFPTKIFNSGILLKRKPTKIISMPKNILKSWINTDWTELSKNN